MCYLMADSNVKLNVSNGPKMDDKVDFLCFTLFLLSQQLNVIQSKFRVKSFILVFLVLMKQTNKGYNVKQKQDFSAKVSIIYLFNSCIQNIIKLFSFFTVNSGIEFCWVKIVRKDAYLVLYHNSSPKLFLNLK